MKQDISQQNDASYQSGAGAGKDGGADASTFDFGRLDRIPKSQLRALNLVHENFVRSLASSLSAYLRSYLVLNLVSIEQISYSEFLEGLASPTCIAYLGLQPYDGTAVLELNTGLVFALVELLLGSKGRSAVAIQRKITEIEKNLVQTLLKVVLRDLSEAWRSVADVSFSVQSLASEPQWLHVLAPAEAVVVISIEVKVDSASGLMNLAIPSIFIKRLRNKFDLLSQVRKAESTEKDQAHVAHLLRNTSLEFEAKIDAGVISGRDLCNLKLDDLLVLEHALEAQVNGSLNGRDKWLGNIVTDADKLVFQLNEAKASPH